MKYIYNDIYKAFQKCDEKWIQRKRKINTASLFNTLVNCCTQGRGVNHILRMDNEKFSSQAIHSARKKLPKGSFKESIILYMEDRGNHVYLRLTARRCTYILHSWKVDTKQEPMINQSRDQQRDL